MATIDGSFDADAIIFWPGDVIEFISDAIVLRTIGLTDQAGFSDDFNRSVSQGLGSEYTWYEDYAGVGEHDNVFVDGSSVVFPAVNLEAEWSIDYGGGWSYSYHVAAYTGIPSIESGIVQFDFWVPAPRLPHPYEGGFIQPSYLVVLDEGPNPVSLRVGRIDDEFWILSGVNNSDWFIPVPETWYTAQLKFQADGYSEFRVWEAIDSEPDDPFFTSSGIAEYVPIWFGLSFVGIEAYSYWHEDQEPGDLKFDNLIISQYELAALERFSADGRIAPLPETQEDAFLASAVVSAGYRTAAFGAYAMVSITRSSGDYWCIENCGGDNGVYQGVEYLHLDAQILGIPTVDIAADAWINNPGELSYQFDLSAEAWVGRTLTADAWIKDIIVSSFRTDVWVTNPTVASFTAKSFFVPGPPTLKLGDWTMDAWVVGTVAVFTTDAQIADPTTRSGSFAAIAEVSLVYRRFSIPTYFVVLEHVEDVFGCYAFISLLPVPPPDPIEITLTFTADALVELSFKANARIQVPRTGTWSADAILENSLVTVVTADAWIREEEDPGGWTAAGGVLADAWLVGSRGSFPSNAVTLQTFSGTFVASSYVPRVIPADAVLRRSFTGEIESAALIATYPADSFTADSFIGFNVRADAFIQPYFRADAYIRREFASRLWFSANAYIYDPRWFTVNAYLYKPGAINPPPPAPPPDDGDPNPPPTPPPPAGPPPQYSKIRILIKSGGTTTDITKDVVWNETEFTQAAKTAPGTFRCTLRGEFTQYDGGEDIYVEVDGFRQFGGLVTMVEYDYWYPNVAVPKTVLLGTDYNIYFDKLVLWNRAENTGTSGLYVNFRGYRADLSDRSIIRHVCANMIDLPPGFDYLTYVDKLDDNWLEGERYYFNTGMSFREFMSEMSRVTAGVWWIDQHLHLHYHARGVVTAPAAITDTQAGVSCRNLEWRGDTGSMVNDIRVWGTLATTVAGKIVMSHNYDAGAIAKFGLRQYGEFRSDLHDTDHIRKRASSIRFRRGIVVETASLDIFESGFTAGQVVQVNMTTFGKSKAFVIRQVQTRFATMAPPDGTTYYGVPIYHLELGLDPEDPWNFYDMLPFDIPPWDVPLGFVFPQWGGFEICQSHNATDTDFIAHTVTLFDEDGFGFGDAWPMPTVRHIGPGQDIWPSRGDFPLEAHDSGVWPYKWGPWSFKPDYDFFVPEYMDDPGFNTFSFGFGNEWPYPAGLSDELMLFNANMGGHVRTRPGYTTIIINRYEYATPLREGLFGVDVSGLAGGGYLQFGATGHLTYPLGEGPDNQSRPIGGEEWYVSIGYSAGSGTSSIELRRGALAVEGPPENPLYYYTNSCRKSWYSISVPSRFWVRIRPEDDCIRVKIWDMCGTEPENWTYETESNPILGPLISVGTMISFQAEAQTYPPVVPEIQFSAIEISSAAGTGYLINQSWPRTYYGDNVATKGDITDHSKHLGDDGYYYPGTAWSLYTNLPWLTHGFHWGMPWVLSEYSTSEPQRIEHTSNYLPEFSVALDWPWWIVYWDSVFVPLSYEQIMSTGAASGTSSTLRSVLRPSWAPYTFHFKANFTIEQGLTFGAWMFNPGNEYGNGGYYIRFFKYTGGFEHPTTDANGRINEKETIAMFSWYGDGRFPNETTMEWSYDFQPGENRLIYGVEILNDWKQLLWTLGLYGGPLFGGPTRTLTTRFSNEEIWLTWGDPTPDALNGITTLPGIAVPLEVLPTKEVAGYTFIDSGASSIAVKDMPRWGWFTETVLVNRSGYFISTGGYVRGSFSVWYTGDHLVPEKDWVSVGPVGGMGVKLWRFRLTDAYRAANPAIGMVSLTYLIDNPAADPGWTRPSRSTVTDVLADRNRMIDVRGLN